MTRNQRIGLVVAALAVAVLAFVIAQPGDDEDDSQPASTTQAATETTGAETETGETATTPEPPPPEVTRIQIEGGAVVGGVKTIEAEKDELVRIVVTADAPDEIHLHGYDIEREAAPGSPARFRFKANVEGSFEIESHTAEHAGNEPLIARLNVGPS
jgi:hypothetical protein